MRRCRGCCNLASVITLINYTLHKNLIWSVEFFANNLFVIGIGIGIAWAHVWFGRRTGHYSSVAPSDSSTWKRYIAVYASARIELRRDWLLRQVYRGAIGV